MARRSCSCVFYAAPFLWALLLRPAIGYAKKHNTLFVFGDSLFDPGNNQYVNATPGGGDVATSPPYGETYFKHATGRLSDGRLVPDFIAEFAKLPILPPYLQPGTQNLTDGANFASSGGAVLPSDHPGPIDLGKQLDYFKEAVKSLRAKLGDAGAKRVLRSAVYLFSIGGNDYFRLYRTKPNVTQSYRRVYISIVVGNITSALKEIYGLGGRKIAFQNAGPLGCLPAVRARSNGTGCAEELQAHARLHNRELAITLRKLKTQLPGLEYSIFDYYNSLKDRIFNPSKYGFKDGQAACCGSGPYRGSSCGGMQKYEVCSDPSEYIWFDGGHTTEAANYQLAQLIWSAAAPVTGPSNVRQFFAHYGVNAVEASDSLPLAFATQMTMLHMDSFGSLFLTLSFCAILLLPLSCRAELPENHVAFFIFGDSLLDSGNNIYLNFSGTLNFPYGETFFKHPTGRVCDGRIVPDFISEYAKLPYIKPYLEPGFTDYTNGVNFACAGAGVLPETHPGTLYFKLQLNYFEEVVKGLKQQLGDAGARKLLSKAVYLFSIGGNDYNAIQNNPEATASFRKMYMTMVLGNITEGIKQVYALGGRKFAFQNVGPIGCMPATRAASGSEGCVHDPTVIAKMHNIALSRLLKRIKQGRPGFKYALFDYYTSLTMRTLYSSKFGFRVGMSACCGSGPFNGQFSCGKMNGTTSVYNLCSDPSEYVWFDAAHPTEMANRQLASLLWDGPSRTVGPYNMKMFFEMS
ncbi:uncharacterized protein LOC115685670 [Syzygium oleosum]|uniref:uncharacterized protein LOC115685670 n=1 Tax=Syzygium oleosum TaxID=219896 RepID=UPI0024BB40A9|nr:uncharacterized protein LOC115685670 [Syzygium oleosum]